MTVPESAISAYLASCGFGTVGTSIFTNVKPATPDNLVSVFGYAGSAPDWSHDTSGNRHPGIQVWVRNTNAATARTNTENIYNLLDGITNTTLSGNYFEGIFVNGDPIPMGKDENGRTEFSLNFSTTIRR